jgi:hypothetical protein
MKKLFIISLLLIISHSLIGCGMMRRGNVSGKYVSVCKNLGFPELVVEFNEDHSFIYKHSHNPDLITGKWTIIKDTLFLSSKNFEAEISSIGGLVDYVITNNDSTDVPCVYNGQYTSAKDQDIYLIKGKKLYPMSKEGFSKNCVLRQVRE